MDSTTLEFQTPDIEILKKMEDEHLRLRRQVRMIQADRQNRTMGVHPQFRRQDELLTILKKEYKNLAENLNIARSGAHKKNDKRMKTDLKKTLLLRMRTHTECDEGISLMEELNGLLQRKKKEILKLRKLSIASKGQLDSRRTQSESRLMSTENKLEQATLRFNILQWENRMIREEIEHMLTDRTLFNQAWNKMLNALGKGKKFLLDLFESSTIAYDQRDEWCNKLRSVQEKGKIDQTLQMQEMRDLKKAYDHEMKLYHFLAKKGVIRINKKQEEREEEQRKKEDESVKRELNTYKKVLHDIYKYTGEPDADKIIEQFQLTELKNHSVYKLLMEFCAENQVLSRDVARVRQDIEDRKDWNERQETRRQLKLENLRKLLEEKTKSTDELRNKFQEKEQLINDVMEKISDMFKMVNCSTDPFQNLLGDKQPSIHLLSFSMRLISEQIKEYIEIVHYCEHVLQKKRSDKVSTSRLKKYTVHTEPIYNWQPIPINILVPADPCPACVEARWLSRVSETAEVPFNKGLAMAALLELSADPSYEKSDRMHALEDCRLPRSRVILARRYL